MRIAPSVQTINRHKTAKRDLNADHKKQLKGAAEICSAKKLCTNSLICTLIAAIHPANVSKWKRSSKKRALRSKECIPLIKKNTLTFKLNEQDGKEGETSMKQASRCALQLSGAWLCRPPPPPTFSRGEASPVHTRQHSTVKIQALSVCDSLLEVCVLFAQNPNQTKC